MIKSLRILWRSYGTIMLKIASVLMMIAATVWLGYQFYRLLWQPERIGMYEVVEGGIDLKARYLEVHIWFAGIWMYGEISDTSFTLGDDHKERFRAKGLEFPEEEDIPLAFYPPASYAILWLLMGWMSLDHAIILWAVTSCCLLGWLVVFVIRESGTTNQIKRLFIGLLPLAIYASGATIGNGQLVLHLLPPLFTGLILCDQKISRWRHDILIAGMVLFSLTKPNLTAPFFWILLFRPRCLRPVFLVIGGYLTLTLGASLFQPVDAITLMQAWIKNPSASAVSAVVDSTEEGFAETDLIWTHSSIHSLLAMVNLEGYALYGSLIILCIQGIWTFWNRRADIWLLMGVAGLTDRFWMYHLWYDDLLILPAMIALFRIANHNDSDHNSDVIAGFLFGVTLLVMIAPGGQYLLPLPWNIHFMTFQSIIWLTILLFLVHYVRKKQIVMNSINKLQTSCK